MFLAIICSESDKHFRVTLDLIERLVGQFNNSGGGKRFRVDLLTTPKVRCSVLGALLAWIQSSMVPAETTIFRAKYLERHDAW